MVDPYTPHPGGSILGLTFSFQMQMWNRFLLPFWSQVLHSRVFFANRGSRFRQTAITVNEWKSVKDDAKNGLAKNELFDWLATPSSAAIWIKKRSASSSAAVSAFWTKLNPQKIVGIKKSIDSDIFVKSWLTSIYSIHQTRPRINENHFQIHFFNQTEIVWT